MVVLIIEVCPGVTVVAASTGVLEVLSVDEGAGTACSGAGVNGTEISGVAGVDVATGSVTIGGVDDATGSITGGVEVAVGSIIGGVVLATGGVVVAKGSVRGGRSAGSTLWRLNHAATAVTPSCHDV